MFILFENVGFADELEHQKVLLMSVNEFFDRVENNKEVLYLYDVPIAKRLSALFESWKLPAYFCKFDYLGKTRLDHPFRNWPTLFIGAQVNARRYSFFDESQNL